MKVNKNSWLDKWYVFTYKTWGFDAPEQTTLCAYFWWITLFGPLLLILRGTLRIVMLALTYLVFFPLSFIFGPLGGYVVSPILSRRYSDSFDSFPFKTYPMQPKNEFMREFSTESSDGYYVFRPGLILLTLILLLALLSGIVLGLWAVGKALAPHSLGLLITMITIGVLATLAKIGFFKLLWKYLKAVKEKFCPIIIRE